MKFARRQPLPGPDAADAPPPPPTPPRGSPEAAFAGILDGQRLWLAIEEAPGSLALRDTASGDVIAPENEVGDDQPGYRALRVDLAQLPGGEEATYDVVLVPARGRAPKPVWSRALSGPRPRPAGDGRTQWRLGRTDEGRLRVHRGRSEEAAELRSVEVVDAGLRLTVAGTGSTLALLADGEPVLTVPVSSGDGDTVSVTIDAASLPEAREQPTQVALGEPGAWLPIRRRANDLVEPGRGAPLPVITDESERERLRLRWSPRALLMARVLDPEAP